MLSPSSPQRINKKQPKDVEQVFVSYEELRELGIRPIRDIHREKVAKHKEIVEQDVAQRNYEAKVALLQLNNRKVKERIAELKRHFNNSVEHLKDSAYLIDQYQENEERLSRLAHEHRTKMGRWKRNELINAASTTEKELRCPRSPLGDCIYVGSTPVIDVVDPSKILVQMALDQKIVEDQLSLTRSHRKAISKEITKELGDTIRMFPRLLDDTQQPTKSSNEALSPLMRPSTAAAIKSPAMSSSSNSPINNTTSNNTPIKNIPYSNSPYSIKALANLDTLSPAPIITSTTNSIRSGDWSNRSNQGSSRNESIQSANDVTCSPYNVSPVRSSSNSPKPFPLIRQLSAYNKGFKRSTRPLSPSKDWLQNIEKLSVRFDSEVVPLPLRPGIPQTITSDVVLGGAVNIKQ